MKLTIEPTEHFFMAGDVMVRMWQGSDDAGLPVLALVTCVAFPADGRPDGLVSIPPPDAAAAERWARKVLGDTHDWTKLPNAGC